MGELDVDEQWPPKERRLRAIVKDGAVMDKAKSATTGAPVFQLHLFEGQSVRDESWPKLEFLRAHRWLDEQTFQVSIRMLILNAEGSLPFYHLVKVRFVFGRS